MRQEMRIKSLLNRYTMFLFSVPALILYCVFVIYPIFSGFYYSMTDWNGIDRTFKFIGLRNFELLIKDGRVWNSMRVTLYYCLLSTASITSIALLLALMLNSKIKFRIWMRSVYFFPAVLSLIIVGLIFNEIFSRMIPQLGHLLNIEALSINIFSNEKTAIYGILLINIWQGVSQPMVLFIAGLQSIPSDLVESSIIDGANSFQRFKNIIFPFIVPVINVVLVLQIKAGLMIFDYIKATTQGGPGRATESITILIMDQAFGRTMRYSYAITETFLMFFIIIVVSFIQIKYLGKKEAGQL